MEHKDKYLKYKKKYLNLKNPKKNLLLFKAEWCKHCKDLIPVWDSLKKSFSNKYNFISYDYKNDKEMMEKYDIKGFPTIYIKNEKNEIEEYVGPRDINSMTVFLSD